MLKACSNKHHVIAGGGGTPTLADAAYFMAPDGVTLLKKLEMARSAHACLWVVLETLLGRDHPTDQVMDMVAWALMDWETDLEDYSHHDH